MGDLPNSKVDFSSFNQQLACININSQTTFSSKNSTSISISFDSDGICLKFPKYKSTFQTYDMLLTKSDVIEVFAYCDEYAFTFISVVTSPKLVEDIEQNLKTFKIKSPYYNPNMEWSKELKISFLLQNASEEILKVLNSLYGEEKVKSIQKNEAYILLKSPSVENSTSPELVTSRSLVYPSVGGIQVKPEDIAQLAHGKYLNDTIIEFYLKYIYNEKLSPSFQTKTHIFNPFFYECLQRVVKTALNGTGLKAFDRIYTWIKNVDIFSKDFIFIPINKSQHWYVVAVCFISMICKTTEEIVLDDDTAVVKETSESPSSDPKSNLRKTRKQNETIQLDRNKPFVCFFDSSDDSCRFNKEKTEVANILKAFFRILWEKQNPDKTCQWDKLLFYKPRCPQQRNKYDCGIFLLQYVESFFEIPISGFQDPFFDMRNWFSASLVKGKRTYIKNLILKLKEKQKEVSVPPVDNSHSADPMEIVD